MDVSEIVSNKQRSDVKTAAKMVGITATNASAALKRTGSKYHNQVITALSKVISARDSLLADKETHNG